jgi:hypothetical protein
VRTGSYESTSGIWPLRPVLATGRARGTTLYDRQKGTGNSDPAPISKPKESIRDMPRIPSLAERQRRLFPMTESSVNLPAEQQRELQIAMADLLLSAFVGSSSHSTNLCVKRRSTEDESKADR